MRHLALLVPLLAFAVGCGGGDRQLRRITVVDAVARTLDTTEGRVQVRYNPAQCACAPFEVHTEDGWVRAAFSEADEEQDLDALLAKAESDDARGILAEYPVAASLVTTAPSFCQNRVPYASLRLETE